MPTFRVLVIAGLQCILFAVSNVFFALSVGIAANMAAVAILISLPLLARSSSPTNDKRQQFYYSQSIATANSFAASTVAFTYPVIWLAHHEVGQGLLGAALVGLSVAAGAAFAALIICKVLESASKSYINRFLDKTKEAKEPKAILDLIDMVSTVSAKSASLTLPAVLAILAGLATACALVKPKPVPDDYLYPLLLSVSPASGSYGSFIINPAFVALGFLFRDNAKGVAIGTLLAMVIAAGIAAVLPASAAVSVNPPDIGGFIKTVGTIILACASVVIVVERTITLIRATRYQLTQSALTKLREANVPEEVLTSLNPLVDQEFATRARFKEALTQYLTDEQTVLYQDALVNHSKVNQSIETSRDSENPSGTPRLTEVTRAVWSRLGLTGTVICLLVMSFLVAVAVVSRDHEIPVLVSVVLALFVLLVAVGACVIAEGVVAVTGVTLNPSSAFSLLTGLAFLAIVGYWNPGLSLPAVMCCAFAAAAAAAAAGFSQDALICFRVAPPPDGFTFFRVQYRWKMLFALVCIPVALLAAWILIQLIPKQLEMPQASALHGVFKEMGETGLTARLRLAILIGVLLAAVVRMLRGSIILAGVGMILSPTLGMSLFVGAVLAQAVAHLSPLKMGKVAVLKKPPAYFQETPVKTATCNAAIIFLVDTYFLASLLLLVAPQSVNATLAQPYFVCAFYVLAALLLLATIVVAFRPQQGELLDSQEAAR